ncbi:hypothetical protein FXW07_08430 [Methanosarcina sp. DH1]|nr:hypothetical protein [Methanosarcina sp. DH1]MCC4766635.1 hypothetical protein [Methanosarcina sp. DH1]
MFFYEEERRFFKVFWVKIGRKIRRKSGRKIRGNQEGKLGGNQKEKSGGK